MSNYEQKDNSGAMFVNDKKESDTHPDRKGSAMIDGTDYWVSGWINESKSGTKYMSLKFTAKDEAQSKGVAQAKQAVSAPAEFDEDIPFQKLKIGTDSESTIVDLFEACSEAILAPRNITKVCCYFAITWPYTLQELIVANCESIVA